MIEIFFAASAARSVPSSWLVSAALEHEPVIGKAAAVAPLLDPHQFGVAAALPGELDSRHLGGARRRGN